jgi:hypothetical protein
VNNDNLIPPIMDPPIKLYYLTTRPMSSGLIIFKTQSHDLKQVIQYDYLIENKRFENVFF